MKKYLYMLCITSLFIFVEQLKAQSSLVGINRDNPSTTLDVGGGVAVSGPIYLGGSDSQRGDAGVVTRVMTSRGDGLSPVWSNLGQTLPKYGNYFLQKTIIRNDTKNGLVIPSTEQVGSDAYELGGTPYIINANSNWKEFTDFRIDLVPTTNPQRIVFQLQVGVSSNINSTSSGWNSFAIGLAIDDPSDPNKKILKAVRYGVVRGTKNPLELFYMTFIIDDMQLVSSSKLYIMAGYRANSAPANGTSLYLGAGSASLRSGLQFLTTASMRVDIYEKFR